MYLQVKLFVAKYALLRFGGSLDFPKHIKVYVCLKLGLETAHFTQVDSLIALPNVEHPTAESELVTDDFSATDVVLRFDWLDILIACHVLLEGGHGHILDATNGRLLIDDVSVVVEVRADDVLGLPSRVET